MLIIIPAYLWDTRLHVAALVAVAAASVDSCTLVVASRSNSLPLIGCERAAISCTRMAHENGLHLLLWDRAPIIIVIPASATLRSMGDRDSANFVTVTVQASQTAESVRLMDKLPCRSVSVSACLLSPLSLSFSPYLQLYLYRFLYLGAIVKLPGATIKSSENTQSFYFDLFKHMYLVDATTTDSDTDTRVLCPCFLFLLPINLFRERFSRCDFDIYKMFCLICCVFI